MPPILKRPSNPRDAVHRVILPCQIELIVSKKRAPEKRCGCPWRKFDGKVADCLREQLTTLWTRCTWSPVFQYEMHGYSD